jgi:hypothetical protein
MLHPGTPHDLATSRSSAGSLGADAPDSGGV